MKRKIKLFIDSAKNYYLVEKKFINCDKCLTPLNNIFFMLINWSRKNSNINIVCKDCLIKVEKTGEVFEAKFGRVVSKVEPDFIPVFIQTPNLTTSKNRETVFSACDLESDQTIDKAWRSREYPSLEGASVGLDVKELENKDKVLSLDEGLNYLDNLKSQEVLIESKEIKKLK